MLDRQTQPLEIAARVLTPDTLTHVRKAPYHLRGWNILDRWALNSPEELWALAASGKVALLGRLLEQQALEQQIVLDNLSLLADGVSEAEILQMRGIQTELV